MENSKTQEYLVLLDKIEQQISFLEVEEAEAVLDEVFRIKPVRLKWYLLKAKLMMRQHKTAQQIDGFLSDKCAPWYSYIGVSEYCQLLSEIWQQEGNQRESSRYLYLLGRLKKETSVWEAEKEKLIQQLLKIDTICKEQMQKLSEIYYITGDLYLSVLWAVAAGSEIPEWILQRPNAGYYYERLTNQREEMFAVIEEAEQKEGILTCKALRLLEKKVKYLCLSDRETDISGYIMEQLQQPDGENQSITILASGWLLEKAALSDKIKPRLERLTQMESECMEDKTAVGRYGNYLAYIANIYKTSYEEIYNNLYKKPTCRFSIIIPCRSAGSTLYYTLKTCLNQSFQGSYEIIVSDNSDQSIPENQTEIYKVCRDIGDDRIKYYRTPRELPLAKAFEYAYLRTNGEFLIAMGADDGILPWALEELDGIMERFPEQAVFLWHEVSYKWADVDERLLKGNGEAVLTSDVRYQKRSQNVYEYSAKEVFEKCFTRYESLYFLPQLYHNSGMRREYLAKLYEKTGVLWSGISQDVCMAVVLGNIEEKLCFIENPLTIQGIGNESIGAQYKTGSRELSQENIIKKLQKTMTQGARVQSAVERRFPQIGTVDGELYACVMYGYAIGAIKDEMLQKLDQREMYKKTAEQIAKWDILADAKIHKLRYGAALNGEAFLEWFERECYEEFLKPEKIENISDSPKEVKPYKEHILVENELVEAEPYSINNIYKAALFLQELFQEELRNI